jgi:hypothetical protein
VPVAHDCVVGPLGTEVTRFYRMHLLIRGIFLCGFAILGVLCVETKF